MKEWQREPSDRHKLTFQASTPSRSSALLTKPGLFATCWGTCSGRMCHHRRLKLERIAHSVGLEVSINWLSWMVNLTTPIYIAYSLLQRASSRAQPKMNRNWPSSCGLIIAAACCAKRITYRHRCFFVVTLNCNITTDSRRYGWELELSKHRACHTNMSHFQHHTISSVQTLGILLLTHAVVEATMLRADPR